jgi:signal transduction histidine kinase/HAMP domain-containing protein
MTWGGIRGSSWRTRRARFADWWFTFSGQHMSLAFKLAVPVILTTAILAAFMGTTVNNEIQVQIESAYGRQAKSIASGVEAMYLQHPQDTALIEAYLTGLVKRESGLVSVRIHSLDAAVTVIASSDPTEVGEADLPDPESKQAIWDGRFFQDENDGPVLITVEPLRDGDFLFGAVVIESSKSEQFAAIRAITFAIGAAAFASIVIESIFVLSALYLGIIRRTRRVQRAVEAVARGDTSVRLGEGRESRGRDEIFNLARSVDRMIRSLDERQRGDVLIRRLSRRALEGVPTPALIDEGLNETRQALDLESCLFATVKEDGAMAGWLDGSGGERPARMLPTWVFALTRVAVEARRAVHADRLGQVSGFAEAPGAVSDPQAIIVPLPRTSKAGQAIVAIARPGETIPDGGLAVLDAVAATIAESLHMQAAENARAESAVKSRVMAAVSHEMRNPLNSILGFTGLVLGPGTATLTDKQRRQLGYVQSSANNMLTLVNNYLDLSKVRAGAVALQYETVKPGSIVDEVAGALQPQAKTKGVTIRTSAGAGGEVRTDPTRLRQILINLVSNAIKFTPERGRVFVRARVTGGGLRIAVSDTGVGIPRDQQKLLFTEFAKIDAGAMAASKGSGLGLALTHAFVVAMGGAIKVYSRRGRGTTFVVTIPGEAGPARREAA